MQYKKVKVTSIIGILLLTLFLTACPQENAINTQQNNVETKQADRLYEPNPPQPPTPYVANCSYDISQSTSNLQYLPSDPLQANSMIMPLNEAKSVFISLTNDQSCQIEAQQMSELLRGYWQAWINLDHQKDLILVDGNRIQCRAGCMAFSSGNSASCEQQCESDYSSVLSSLDAERQSNTQEMNAFFRY